MKAMKDLKSARQRFKSMHDRFFVIPNAWNVGEIRLLQKVGFEATTGPAPNGLSKPLRGLIAPRAIEILRPTARGYRFHVHGAWRPDAKVGRMRYALHNKQDASELRFRTLKALWAHVRANDLCSEETDVDDLAHARRLLSPRFEIHDIDIDGVVRVEARAPPPNVE